MQNNKNRYFNISSLANISIQFLNYAVPIISYPYLGRVLGATAFGSMSFWLAIAGFLSVITEYGYRYSAAKLVTEGRPIIERQAVYWAAQYSRLLIFFIIFILGSAYLIFDDKYTKFYFFSVSCVLIFGSALFPAWFFIGCGRYKEMALLLAAPRFLSLLCIFIFVKNSDHVLLAVLFQSIPLLLSGILAQIFLIKKLKIQHKLPSFLEVTNVLRGGWREFISALAMSGYQTLPVIFLGFTSSAAHVASYAITEKIIQAIKSLTTALGQTIFSKNIAKNDQLSYKYFIKDNSVFFAVNMAFCVIINIFGYYSKSFLGNSYVDIVEIFAVMSLIPLVAGFSNVAGVQTLLPLGKAKVFMYATAIAGGFGILSGVLLSSFMHGIGMALGVLLAEVILACVLTLNAVKALDKKESS
nr:oligosaccharide flippase family protein [uncultured Albidiferax sp.]